MQSSSSSKSNSFVNERTTRISNHRWCLRIDDDNVVECDSSFLSSNVVECDLSFFSSVVECDFSSLFRVATKSRFVLRSRSFRRSRRDSEFESHVEREAIASNRSTSHDLRAIIHDEKLSSEKTNETSQSEENVSVLRVMTNVTSVSNVVVTNATILFFLKISMNVLKCAWIS
jgi:hypothetical protein